MPRCLRHGEITDVLWSGYELSDWLELAHKILFPPSGSGRGRSAPTRIPMNRALLCLASVALTSSVMAAPILVGPFSTWSPSAGLGDDWKTVTFKNVDHQTHYTLTVDNGTTIIRADSQNSASLLARKIDIDPEVSPILRWRWKILDTISKGNVHHKSGDDYAARLYITFDYDRRNLDFFDRVKAEVFNLFYGEYPPLRAITYIWDHNNPQGLVVANPYTDNVMMFVIESGSKNSRRWVHEQRNVVDDYRAAFGEPAPRINGIALMTDSDNTGASATAWYGDISLGQF
ncbi:MAG TPA: DUF3047 domain-containing protein [Chromatiaceae bacterium]|nr:DUF3047 domain-containing protein [Chromatiaceae bacterium]HIB84703.1 DUF3047 domain-containing protein [Chromatiaceae bacterium]HIO14321.1 DUF3047 domain-containing protein [Chromatiales bacterium]